MWLICTCTVGRYLCNYVKQIYIYYIYLSSYLDYRKAFDHHLTLEYTVSNINHFSMNVTGRPKKISGFVSTFTPGEAQSSLKYFCLQNSTSLWNIILEITCLYI